MLKICEIDKILRLSNKEKAVEGKLMEAVNPKNACFYYAVHQKVSSKSIEVQNFNYVERWFMTLVNSKNHLVLDFESFRKICTSSHLNTTTEIEVAKAVDTWVKHDTKERSRLAIELIKTIRLPLMSTAAKNALLLYYSSFSSCKKCVRYVKTAPKFKKQITLDPHSVNLQNRYCGGDRFDVAISGGKDKRTRYGYSSVIHLLKGSNLSTARTLNSSQNVENTANVVFLNGNIHHVGIADGNISISSYSILERNWTEPVVYHHIRADRITVYNACAFMNRVYITYGGKWGKYELNKTIVSFDPKTSEFRKGATMNEYRNDSACSVFAGRIVVSGGIYLRSHRGAKQSVEGYDGEKWAKMPGMLEGRSCHSSAAVRNKLFVFGGKQTASCEAFDFVSRTFARVKGDCPFVNSTRSVKLTVAIGSKILLFNNESMELAVFDVEEEKWSDAQKVHSEFVELVPAESLREYFCLKLPHH